MSPRSRLVAAKPRRERCVYINCPFDSEFADLFDALVFATMCCGFVPRSSLSGRDSELRMNRIFDELFSSKYSIHDLSRCRGEGDQLLARFNMPLELGIAMATTEMARRNGTLEHDWFVMVPVGVDRARYASDLLGYDCREYDGTVRDAILKVMSFLESTPDAVAAPSPPQVVDALPDFAREMARLRNERRGTVPWPHVVRAAEHAVPRL